MPTLLEHLPKPDSISALVERLGDRLLSRIVPDQLAEAGHCSCGCNTTPEWYCWGCLMCYPCYDCENGNACQGCHYSASCCY
jgi:hypothetical protein